MRPHSRQQTPPPRAPRSKGRDIVQRELNSITCRIDVRSDWSYELCVVPHWDPSAAMFERFDAPTPALLRHVEISQQLRAEGWAVIDHGAALSILRAT
jgi:hypothetical protein